MFRALTFALGLAFAPMAAAEEFTLLIYEPDADLASRDDPAQREAYWSRFNAFAGAMAQAGVLRGGTALSESAGTTVDSRGARHAMRTLRRTRTGGYLMIDAPSMEEAVRWAMRAPGLDEGVIVEVRPHRANPIMNGQDTR